MCFGVCAPHPGNTESVPHTVGHGLRVVASGSSRCRIDIRGLKVKRPTLMFLLRSLKFRRLDKEQTFAGLCNENVMLGLLVSERYL